MEAQDMVLTVIESRLGYVLEGMAQKVRQIRDRAYLHGLVKRLITTQVRMMKPELKSYLEELAKKDNPQADLSQLYSAIEEVRKTESYRQTLAEHRRLIQEAQRPQSPQQPQRPQQKKGQRR